MHYLAFSLGHKLHSSILLIYFVCMKQIELLHASRSRLTEISLLHNDANEHLCSPLSCGSTGKWSMLQMCVNYLVVEVKPIWYFYLNTLNIPIHSHPQTAKEARICAYVKKLYATSKGLLKYFKINENHSAFAFSSRIFIFFIGYLLFIFMFRFADFKIS